MSNRTFLAVFSLLVLIFAGAVVTGAWLVTRSAGPDSVDLVGGPFQLTDHTGRPVSDSDYDGMLKIVYFGYTYCPDICPTGLTVISDALDGLDDAAKMVKPLFITVDPERDTVGVLAEYHEHFHPRFSFLTGTAEQIATLARAYRVYYQKAEREETSDYLVDHSTVTYLMDREGGYLGHFNHDMTSDQLVTAIRNALAQIEERNTG